MVCVGKSTPSRDWAPSPPTAEGMRAALHYLEDPDQLDHVPCKRLLTKLPVTRSASSYCSFTLWKRATARMLFRYCGILPDRYSCCVLVIPQQIAFLVRPSGLFRLDRPTVWCCNCIHYLCYVSTSYQFRSVSIRMSGNAARYVRRTYNSYSWYFYSDFVPLVVVMGTGRLCLARLLKN